MKRFLGFVLFVNGLLLAADSPQMAALADTLFKSCTNKQCDFLIQIESNQLLSIDTLSALQEASIQNDFAKTETAETLPPISDECRKIQVANASKNFANAARIFRKSIRKLSILCLPIRALSNFPRSN